MANPVLLASINATLGPGWVYNCVKALNESDYSWTQGIVDGHGQPLSGLTNASWGITIETCYQYCNQGYIPYATDFNFQTFASAMTNYFLPWLALTAQLPFETGNPWRNAMSFCLAVGSPALITYSLVITILNRIEVRKIFGGLLHKAKASKNRHDYVETIKAVQYLLREGQQVPLRASQEKGWLSSLIVLPGNKVWWENLGGRLRATRRGFTASLVAQMALAIIAYLFTVIASFMADLGDPATALQIASGSLWIWLIPVILGWITVGTQSSDHSIEDALDADVALRAPENLHVRIPAMENQKGLRMEPSLTIQPLNPPNNFAASPVAHLEIPKWWGAAVEGDEQQKGPTYNYARVFTFWQLVATMKQAVYVALDHVENGRIVQSDLTQHQWDVTAHDQDLVGSSVQTARYCALDQRVIKAYPDSIRSDVGRTIMAAILAALFVQWGTTGASILIAYNTPTIGFGCRSTAYVIYGGLGTATWFLLWISSLLSYEAMLRYQRQHVLEPAKDFRVDPDRSIAHSIICGAAVITRYAGKLLAILNTSVLIVSSLAEFIGLFDNCWCQGNAIGLGSKDWVVLFKGAPDLKLIAASSWYGGLIMTVVVCAASYTFFAFGSSFMSNTY